MFRTAISTVTRAPALKALSSTRALCTNTFAVSAGSLIPDFSRVADTGIAVLSEEITVQLHRGCVSKRIKQLDASTFGFDAQTVKNLEYLYVASLDEDMEIPKLPNLFIEDLKGKAVPDAGRLFLSASSYEGVEGSNAGPHYLFQLGDGRIDDNMLVSEKYKTVGAQHVIKAFGREYTVIERALKASPKPDPKYVIIDRTKNLPVAVSENTWIHAYHCEKLEKSNIGDHYLYMYHEIPDHKLVSKRYKTVGEQKLVQVAGDDYYIIKRTLKGSPAVSYDAIEKRVSDLNAQLDKLREELKSLSKE